jgi:TPR repeat protein
MTLCLVDKRSLSQAQSSTPPPSTSNAISQLQERAQSGDAEAQFALGKAYEQGSGKPQSDEKAFKWYKASADQGNARAQNAMGVMYSLGHGVMQDKEEAIRWYHKAAKQLNPNAMFNLGAAHYNGDGVGVDDNASYAWFVLAKNLGDQSASEAIKRMPPRPHLRTLWIERNAYEYIGDMYQNGDFLPQSTSEAINWYRKATGNGAIGSAAALQVKLASLLLQDKTATANYGEAHELCRKAAESHYPAGAYCVGQLYQKGLGVPQNSSNAAKWFTEGTNMGSTPAVLRLGQMYWDGEGVGKDKISAYEYIYLASRSGLPEANQKKEVMEKELTPEEIEKGTA